jgi:large subunit ribosomal protein L23
MKLLADKIYQPLLSEKATRQENKLNEFAIVVDRSLSKTEIKTAVEKLFGIVALSVRTVNFRKKARRTKRGLLPAKLYKKALVRLPEGKRLEFK